MIRFLPATEEEPMPLWKVLIDEYYTDEDCKRRKEDLEEHELKEAIERMGSPT